MKRYEYVFESINDIFKLFPFSLFDTQSRKILSNHEKIEFLKSYIAESPLPIIFIYPSRLEHNKFTIEY